MQVWKFLLGVYDIDSTAVDRVERMRMLRERYRNIRWQWQAITDDQAAHWAKWRERRNQARPAAPLAISLFSRRETQKIVLNIRNFVYQRGNHWCPAPDAPLPFVGPCHRHTAAGHALTGASTWT